jgi:dynein heavy chain
LQTNEDLLIQMIISFEITKKERDDILTAPREGSYVHGLFLEGARWDSKTGSLEEARLKELVSRIPVAHLRAITVDKKESKGLYECPVYYTRARGPTYVWSFGIRTREDPTKWVLRGLALLLST